MTAKEQRMAKLGARNLAPEKKAAESAETAQIQRSSETSILGSLSKSVSRAITEMLDIMAEWEAIEGEISFELNSDFDLLKMPPDQVTALGNSVNQGLLSWETYFYNMQKGEYIPPGIDEDTERSQIEQNQEDRVKKQGEANLLIADNFNNPEDE